MKNILISTSLLILIIFGLLLSLIAIYAAPDNKVHFLEASYIWLGNGLLIFGLLYFNSKNRECK